MTIKIEISDELANDGGASVRAVTVRNAGRTYSARCYFRTVNGRAVYSIGECAPEAFEAIADALDYRGPQRLAALL